MKIHDRIKDAFSTGLFLAMLLFALPAVAAAQEVLAVKFPQGARMRCSDPVTRSFVVKGPGEVTIIIKLNPLKVVNIGGNVPVKYRVGSSPDFVGYHPLPGHQWTKAFQLGKEVREEIHNVPAEIQYHYKLDEAREHRVDVRAYPICGMMPQKVYWQEGQEVRVSVKFTAPLPGGKIPSLNILTSKTWQFGRSDGTVLVARMKLLPDGRIGGANNPNESRWAVAGGELLFYDSAGKISTRYNSFRTEEGRLVISGPFLLWGKITHVLKEVK